MKYLNDLIVNKRAFALYLLWFVLTLDTSLCFQSKLLVRKIQSKPNNITHALNILHQTETRANNYVKNPLKDKDLQNVVVEILRVCRNTNDPDTGMDLYKNYRSEATRAMAISLLGHCDQVANAVNLLDDDFCPPSAASFNNAIAACGRAGNWQLALDIYRNKMPRQMESTLSTNALLTVLAKCRQGAHSLEILEDFVSTTNHKTPGSDSITYSLVIRGLIRSNMLTEACEILGDLTSRQNYCSENSIESMLDLVSSAYSQRSDWNGVDRIEQMRNPRTDVNQENLYDSANTTISTRIAASQHFFQQWEGMERLGKGKDSFWVIGTYKDDDMFNITVGCRPNRNPSRNGIQILFFENIFDDETSSWKQQKVGFLLMNNSWKERISSLLGMFLKPDQRGRGISKVCLSIWIWLSLKGSIVPTTGVIRKPLLALILQHTFGFLDFDDNNATPSGNLVEISQDSEDSNCVVLYPLPGKSLEGAFSFSELRKQNIKITSRQPLKKGRLIRINSRLYPPSDKSNLELICDNILSRDRWACDLSREEIQFIFFGRSLKKEKEER